MLLKNEICTFVYMSEEIDKFKHEYVNKKISIIFQRYQRRFFGKKFKFDQLRRSGTYRYIKWILNDYI